MVISGNILCRNCGSDVTFSDSLISKSSPKSRYSFNDTLFYNDDVLVQVFATDLFFHYPLISFTYSTCVPTGEVIFIYVYLQSFVSFHYNKTVIT